LALVVRWRLVAALALEVPRVGDASQGAIGVMVVGASVTGSTVPGDVVLAPGPSGVMSLELPGPSRLGSPGFASSPGSRMQVENEAELACSQVTTAEWMLHDTLASIHHNILCPIQVSLRKRKTDDPVCTPSIFLHAHLPSPCIAPQLLSWGNADATVLQADMARA
jgi:hypothetical protein